MLNRRKICECGKCGLAVKPGRRFISGHNSKGDNNPSCKNRKYPKPIPFHHLCACGKCNIMVASDKKFAKGHANKGKRWGKEKISQLCACGECGLMTNPGGKYRSGHNKPMQGKHHSEETKVRCGVKPDGFGEKISKALTGRTLSEEHNKNIRLGQVGIKRSKEFGEKMSLALTGRHHTEETKIKMRKPDSEEVKKNKAIANRKTRQNPEYAKLMYESHWGNPEWVEKVRKSLNKSPNKPESFLQTILKEYCPGQWKYTGDFSFMVNGKNPDFVNEEQKLVIEHFGDYWHDGEDSTGRAEIFAQAGYDTLVIWENELKNNLDNVIYKIKQFVA